MLLNDLKRMWLPYVLGAAVVLGWLFWQATFLNWLWVSFRSAPTIILMFIVMAVLLTAGYLKENYAFYTGAFVVLTVMMFTVSTQSHRVAQEYYESVNVVKSKSDSPDIPNYKSRAPLTIARDQTSGNVAINGTAQDTTYMPNEDKFGAVVVKSGWNSGYGAVVYQSIGENGQSNVDNCEFDASANKFLGGWFGKNLERTIVREAGYGVFWEDGDTYAYCDKSTPYFVVPLLEKSGFIAPINVPAGVAVYNGDTGELEIKKDVKVNEIPGPVYPLSLVEKARHSTKASGSWWDYIQKRVGYQDTSAADEKDPNADNAGEFTLARATGDKADYVTQLVPFGKGNAITAIGHVNANSINAGSLNKYTVATMKPRQSNSATEDRIRADYGDLEWAAGMKVFEIAPTGPDSWVATLGRSKSIMYRLTINPDSTSCLYTVGGEKIRCSEDEASESKSEPKKSEDKNSKIDAPDDVSKISDKELAELNRKVQEEINKRLEKED